MNLESHCPKPLRVLPVEDNTARKNTEAELRRLHQELEQRVLERTAELNRANAQLLNEVKERAQAEERLRVQERVLRLITDAMPALISYIDGGQRYRFANEAYEVWFRRPREEVLGQTMREVLGTDAYEAIRPHVEEALTGRPVSYERWLDFQHGGRRYVLASYMPHREGGLVKGFYALVQDLTERRKNEQEIRHLNEQHQIQLRQLEVANRELEAFSYSVSHDLRAPLRGIDGWTNALMSEAGPVLGERGRVYLDRVCSEARRMGELIDDLLNLSRVARAEMRQVSVPLSELAGAILLRFQQAEPERQVQFEIEPGLCARGDAGLLRIVLENLLGNAWKFTAKRPQSLIRFGRAKSRGETAYVVCDNGAGFDMAFAKKLFAPFQRMHRASEFPGTGIGLATVQRIIHRHGGRVWAEAALGQGTAIYFTL